MLNSIKAAIIFLFIFIFQFISIETKLALSTTTVADDGSLQEVSYTVVEKHKKIIQYVIRI